MNELISLNNGTALLNAEISATIADFERQVKYIKEQEESLKTAILNEMEAKGIIKIETEDLIINYIQPTDRETFDSKGFKKDYPDIYDEYVKMTPVKSSVRLKVK